MIIKLTRLIRDLRRRKGVGLGAIFSVVVVSVMGNALTFYLFDGGAAGAPASATPSGTVSSRLPP